MKRIFVLSIILLAVFVLYQGLSFAATPGTLKWKYDTYYHVYSTPSIGSDGTIYVASWDGYLYAINDNGTLKWEYDDIYDYVGSSPAIGQDGTIYIGSWDNNLYAINLNGTLKWKYDVGDKIFSSPAIGASGTIYVGAYNNYLYAINSNGTLKWKYKTGDIIRSSPAIDSNGVIYFGSDDNYLYAINPNGTLKWKYKTGDYIDSSPAIGSDGTIYIGSWDNYLYAINSNGTLKWKYKTGDEIWSSPTVGSDEIIYIGSKDNYLYALFDNGTLNWKYKTGYKLLWSSPAIGSDGTIYIGSEDSYLYAINSSSKGLLCSGWPKFHQNNNNTGSINHFADQATINSQYLWAKHAINCAYIKQITTGYTDGTYRPSNLVTRAEMATFLTRAMGLSPSNCTSEVFSDITIGSWYCKYVKAIKDAGITNGYSDGTYRPNNHVTRAEMAVFLAKATSLSTTDCTKKPFSDVAVDSWYCKYVKAIKDAGITNGYSDGTYRPNNHVTRAEMAVFLYGAFIGQTGVK